jgi:hypothetical protein
LKRLDFTTCGRSISIAQCAFQKEKLAMSSPWLPAYYRSMRNYQRKRPANAHKEGLRKKKSKERTSKQRQERLEKRFVKASFY